MMCIDSTGTMTGWGYSGSQVTIGRGKRYTIRAHRVAFEQAWGISLRADQVVRHTCDRPSCINPLHLMIGTPADNNRDTRERGRHGMSRRTHCARGGHELSEDNLDPWSLKNGRRKCRRCERERQAKRRAA